MVRNITIENFRGIKSLSVENLSRVNLFFGRNNAGKSTVLESVFLLSGMTNPRLLVLCNAVRGFNGIQDFSFFFHNFNTASPVSIISEGDSELFTRKLRMELSDSQSYTQDFDGKTAAGLIDNKAFQVLVLNASSEGETYRNEFRLESATETEENGKIGIITSYNEKLVCKYIAPRNTSISIEELDDILKDKQEQNLIESLSLIDGRIKDFVVSRKNIMVDIGLDTRLPLNMMGDGARKFFNLIVSLYKCRNGILLVDEIDNGLHYSAMEYLWKTVMSMAKKYNVQVFATTHNMDSLKGLNASLAESGNDAHDVSFYKVLRKNDDETKILHYAYKDFSVVLENGNEVR